MQREVVEDRARPRAPCPGAVPACCLARAQIPCVSAPEAGGAACPGTGALPVSPGGCDCALGGCRRRTARAPGRYDRQPSSPIHSPPQEGVFRFVPHHGRNPSIAPLRAEKTSLKLAELARRPGKSVGLGTVCEQVGHEARRCMRPRDIGSAGGGHDFLRAFKVAQDGQGQSRDVTVRHLLHTLARQRESRTCGPRGDHGHTTRERVQQLDGNAADTFSARPPRPQPRAPCAARLRLRAW